MEFITTKNSDTRFVELCSMLDNYLNGIMGKDIQQEKYNKHNELVDIDDVILLVVK